MTDTTKPSAPSRAPRSASTISAEGRVARLLKRSNARSRESSWTREEASAFLSRRYDESLRLPAQRFRVEGTAVGNSHSRFLTRARAESTRAKYGGEIVELVTARPRAEIRESEIREAAKEAPACATCKVPAGEPCLRVLGSTKRLREMHVGRVRAIAAAQAVARGEAPVVKPARARKRKAAAAPTDADAQAAAAAEES